MGAPTVHGTWVLSDDGMVAVNLAVISRVQIIESGGAAQVKGHFGGAEIELGTFASIAVAKTGLASVLDQVAANALVSAPP